MKFSHVSGRKKIETSHPAEFQTNSPIMQGQEPDGVSLASLRTTRAAASQWAFAPSIFLTTANWSEQERVLGL